MSMTKPEDHVQSADAYRVKADESAKVAAAALSPQQGSAALKKQKTYVTLAENEQWLADNSSHVVES
jgi:hypothetical protein